MDFLYFIPTVVITIAAFYVLDRRDERERKEREELLNRIQAPEIAIQKSTAPNNPDYPPIALDDDREFERLTNERIDNG